MRMGIGCALLRIPGNETDASATPLDAVPPFPVVELPTSSKSKLHRRREGTNEFAPSARAAWQARCPPTTIDLVRGCSVVNPGHRCSEGFPNAIPSILRENSTCCPAHVRVLAHGLLRVADNRSRRGVSTADRGRCGGPAPAVAPHEPADRLRTGPAHSLVPKIHTPIPAARTGDASGWMASATTRPASRNSQRSALSPAGPHLGTHAQALSREQTMVNSSRQLKETTS